MDLIAPATLTEHGITLDTDQSSSLYPSKIYILGTDTRRWQVRLLGQERQEVHLWRSLASEGPG